MDGSRELVSQKLRNEVIGHNIVIQALLRDFS
jgi:hypothetical protein